MARIGIGIYGLWPSKETYLSCLLQDQQPLSLKPVLSWKARIAQLKKVPKGAMIGYGCTYKTGRESLLAVVPVGYYDGYPRNLSNSSYVLVNGERAPLRGRVAMNFLVVDVTDISDVRLEDKVILVGKSGEDTISADLLAGWGGTINYEAVTRINPFISRIVV
jgi:alanine racemase